MKLAIRILAGALVALSVACGGGSSGGSGINAVAAVSAIDGNYEGVGTFSVNLIVDDLNSNVPPTVADCAGDITVVVDENATDVLVGSGRYDLPANFMTYELVGGFVNGTDFEGEITMVLNGGANVLNFCGTLNGNVLNATFDGVTLVVEKIRRIWTAASQPSGPNALSASGVGPKPRYKIARPTLWDGFYVYPGKGAVQGAAMGVKFSRSVRGPSAQKTGFGSQT